MKIEPQEEMMRMTTEHEFTYPEIGVKFGQRFPNKGEIVYSLQQEALQRQLPLNLYTSQHSPNGENWRNFILTCKVCRARLNFYNVSGEYVARTLNTKHLHDAKAISSYQSWKGECLARFQILADKAKMQKEKRLEKSNNLLVSAGTKQRQEVGEPSRHLKVEGLQNMLPHRDESHMLYSDYTTIENWMKEHQYYFNAIWENEDASFPDTMVMVSNTMKSNYARYGDLLGFELFDDLAIHNGQIYNLGIFVVADSNSRPLLAGVSFLKEATIALIINAFMDYKRIHQKLPQTLLTADIAEINQTVAKLMRKTGWECNHIFDTSSILKSIGTSLQPKGGMNVNRLLLDLKEAIHTKNPTVYCHIIQKLQNEQFGYASINKLLERKSRVFYCDIKPSFLGLKRNLCSVIRDIVKPLLSKCSMINIINHLDLLDTVLASDSSKFQRYNEDIYFTNRRVDELSQRFEKEVVQRFMENYIRGIKDCSIVRKIPKKSSNKLYLVEDSSNDLRYEVEEWQCGCMELVKTGIPCPHIIVAASSQADKSFVDLFNVRWLKSPNKH